MEVTEILTLYVLKYTLQYENIVFIQVSVYPREGVAPDKDRK